MILSLKSMVSDMRTIYSLNGKLYSPTQKNGIYVHRTNWNGKANGTVSKGCILIQGSQWNNFTNQIGNNGFKMILRR